MNKNIYQNTVTLILVTLKEMYTHFPFIFRYIFCTVHASPFFYFFSFNVIRRLSEEEYSIKRYSENLSLYLLQISTENIPLDLIYAHLLKN